MKTFRTVLLTLGISVGVLTLVGFDLEKSAVEYDNKHQTQVCDKQSEREFLKDLYHSINNNGRDLSQHQDCLLYTSPSPRDRQKSRMPSSA